MPFYTFDIQFLTAAKDDDELLKIIGKIEDLIKNEISYNIDENKIKCVK